jgi:hypothetical protein
MRDGAELLLAAAAAAPAFAAAVDASPTAYGGEAFATFLHEALGR